MHSVLTVVGAEVSLNDLLALFAVVSWVAHTHDNEHSAEGVRADSVWFRVMGPWRRNVLYGFDHH